MGKYTEEQQRFFREHPGAEQVRLLYALHVRAPNDPGALGLLDAAIADATKHPEYPSDSKDRR